MRRPYPAASTIARSSGVKWLASSAASAVGVRSCRMMVTRSNQLLHPAREQIGHFDRPDVAGALEDLVPLLQVGNDLLFQIRDGRRETERRDRRLLQRRALQTRVGTKDRFGFIAIGADPIARFAH